MTSPVELCSRFPALLPAALLFLAGLLPVCGTAQADTGQFGAIAWSQESGHDGYSYNYPTAAEAETRALAECRKKGKSCTIVLTLNEGCGALAAGEHNGYGAIGNERQVAERRALEGCRRQETDCRLVRAFCSGQATAETPAATAPAAPKRSPSAHGEPRFTDQLPVELREPVQQLLDKLQPLVTGGKGIQIIVGFIILVVIFRLIRGAFRLRMRALEFLRQAGRLPSTGGAPDWILDRTPSAAPRQFPANRGTTRPTPPRPAGPVRGTIVHRETGFVVRDMNRSRQSVREKS